MAKTAILSHILPPSPSGQSKALYRLLKGCSPDTYILLSRSRYGDELVQSTCNDEKLSGKYFHLDSIPRLTLPRRRPVRSASELIEATALILVRAREIQSVLATECCSLIIACSGDIADIPAAFIASRRVNIPFVAYLFDDYIYQWESSAYRRLASWFESFIMKRADNVICPNEFLAEEYTERHGIKPVVIHNPIEAYKEPIAPSQDLLSRELAIAYTGSIYHAHYDAFRNLLVVLPRIRKPTVNLHIYTSQPASHLEAEGISGHTFIHPHVGSQEAYRVQREADILFLPLAFQSAIPETIRSLCSCSLPNK